MSSDKFISEFHKNFPAGKGFSVQLNVPLLSDAWKKNTADYVITNKIESKSKFAVIIATDQSKENPVNVTYAKRLIRQMTTEYGFWIGVLWHKGEMSVWNPEDAGKPLKPWKKIGIDELVRLADEFLESGIGADYLERLKSEIKAYKATVTSKEQDETRETLFNWVENLSRKDLILSNRFVTVGSDIQFSLLRSLYADKAKVRSFCRYVSLDGLQRILLNKRESMCGLAGMNDRSEGFFLDKALSNSSFNLYRKPQQQIDDFNRAFILSLCNESMADDLTMWRLYGRDGCGACLIYEADLPAIADSKEFTLSPVAYGIASNKVVLLFKILSRLPYISGFKFTFSPKFIWQYFVKPRDFKIEEEYRLLYVPEQDNNIGMKWILNNTYSIFHPLCEFKSPLFEESGSGEGLKTFPLRLKKIILGPKCAESHINKVQLRAYLSSISSDVEISESNIEFYR